MLRFLEVNLVFKNEHNLTSDETGVELLKILSYFNQGIFTLDLS